MCGIIGYLGYRKAMPILLEGLFAQEYRGYDSAGVAVLEDGTLRVEHSVGKIALLEQKIGDNIGEGVIGIGHTRWATHGRPTEDNCHPHTDCHGNIAVVHNGIIENYLELREWLQNQGHTFTSQTDTEVLPHLLEELYQTDLYQAMSDTVARLRGAYACVAVSSFDPRRLVAARKDSPLVIGVGEGEYFLASDIAALIRYTRNVIILENGDIAVVDDHGIKITNQGQPVQRKMVYVDWDKEAAEKAGFPHFMLKEIHEQPAVMAKTMRGRISDDLEQVLLPEMDAAFSDEFLKGVNKLVIVACGTSYHAGLVAKQSIERLLRLPVEVDIASEYRYRKPLVDEHALVVVVSQSGETADTLAALRESQYNGAKVIAICNVMDSSIAREADCVLYTWAGVEIAVASTKAYVTQLMLLYMLTFYLGQRLQILSGDYLHHLLQELDELPDKIAAQLPTIEETTREWAEYIKDYDDAFFIGRGLDHSVALEGALKLKEISYIHAEAYAAGELKHGTIALIEPGIPVIALATQQFLLEKSISNIVELKARDAHIFGIAFEQTQSMAKVTDGCIYLPQTDDLLAPIITVVPLQLLAYYAADYRGCEIDQPRNLAKSVTVE
ncbi:MAG: glutamine--fructose-6-phosphate transaminase (isomerizing) [Firmicutes bacterium]|nr:glutamine--fructose-6-phosphate transaminase (isomerizing) [Bacillota bacterium]